MQSVILPRKSRWTICSRDRKTWRRVRYLPAPISEDIAGLYLYDEKIAIISAVKENYAIIIESHDLFVLVKTIWQCLWNVAVEPENMK